MDVALLIKDAALEADPLTARFEDLLSRMSLANLEEKTKLRDALEAYGTLASLCEGDTSPHWSTFAKKFSTTTSAPLVTAIETVMERCGRFSSADALTPPAEGEFVREKAALLQAHSTVYDALHKKLEIESIKSTFPLLFLAFS